MEFKPTALTLHKEASVAGAIASSPICPPCFPNNSRQTLSQTNHHPTQRLHFPSSLATRSGNMTKSGSVKCKWTWMVHLEVYLKVATTLPSRGLGPGECWLAAPPWATAAGPWLRVMGCKRGGWLRGSAPPSLPAFTRSGFLSCTANPAPVC